MAKRRKKPGRVRRRPRRRSATVRTTKITSARAVEAALAGIAHDIRTPLTGIVALAELLVSSDLGAREREWATAIKGGADHLAALATLIVDAAKAAASGLLLRNELFAPRTLAETVGTALAARASSKGIGAKIEIATDLPAFVSGDGMRLRAALENLADNAVKFTNEGSVTFTAAAKTVTRGQVRLVFTFADSGIGIGAGELRKLFRPFVQASAKIARLYGGAGLGLSFVKRLAKEMGGDLKVVSKKGVGSSFHLSVLVDSSDVRPATKPAETRPTAGRPLSVLCAEDNPYGRVVMNTILRELGHKADFVETGAAVVSAVERGGYDVVLMDITLSGLNGIEATKLIRALPGRVGQTPVIGISGHSQTGDEEIARRAGMSFYFVKPVSPRKLAEAFAVVSG